MSRPLYIYNIQDTSGNVYIGDNGDNELRVVAYSCLPGTGGVGCPLCAAGTYSSTLPAQASTCQACPAGTWSATTGATQCTPCLSGTYSTTVGASASSVCLPCAGGRWSTIGSTACVPLDRTKVSDVIVATSCLFLFIHARWSFPVRHLDINRHPRSEWHKRRWRCS